MAQWASCSIPGRASAGADEDLLVLGTTSSHGASLLLLEDATALRSALPAWRAFDGHVADAE
jgi:hypothetical protein